MYMYVYSNDILLLWEERKRERNGKGPGIVSGRVNISDTSGFPERRGKMRENT